ncbi:MAG: metallophosphoesterase [Myxococcota bacterium]|nr:metallophosphoesterase [Myxococcota bacterium]
MSLPFVLFFVAIGLTLSAIAVYVHRRATRTFAIGRAVRAVTLVALLIAILLPFAMRFARSSVGDSLAGSAAMVGFGVGLTLLIAAGFLVPFDITRWIATRLRERGSARAAVFPSEPAIPTEPAFTSAPTAAPTLTRRDLLSRSYVGLAIGTGAATSLYGLTLGRHDYVLEQVPIPLRNLPRALDGYTIAQLSDVHVGIFVGERELDAAVELVRRARPDLIVMTGDLIDHDPSYLPVLGRFARRLASLGARDGVVAIPGNHDYYTGIDEVLATLRAAGVDVLRNDARVIGDRGAAFALLGVDDVWAPRNGYGAGADLAASLAQVPPDLARVLLCHNPEYFPEAASRVDLQLSGHTHGGQVNFIVRPADLVLRHGYIRGHYVRGESQIYVNRGFGTAGPPARLGSPPEVSRIVLTTT